MNTKSNNSYQPLSSVIFRSPYFTLNQLLEWLIALDKSPDYLKEILTRTDIQEAIFLASPVLYDEFDKYLDNRLKPKDKEKFFLSVLKYLLRMSSRCTPFGLFAGCSVGHIAELTNISLPDPSEYSRHTRLDMNWLCALALDIAKRKELRYRLLYVPNSSCYVIWNKLRYVKYLYQNGNRQHFIIEVDYSEYLHRLLASAKEGATVEELVALLVNDEISREEAIEFIDKLIDKQILVSELEPSVTGPELLDQMIHTLSKFEECQELSVALKLLYNLLQKIDTQPVGSTLPLYDQIKEQITTLGTSFSNKYLFQCDMLKPCQKAEIDKKMVDDILEAMAFVNKISLSNRQESLLDKFTTSFVDRYEEREVPLAQLLDTEMGLHLRPSDADGDISPLLNGIPFGTRKQKELSYTWSELQSILFQKVLEALNTKRHEIVLADDDVKNTSAHWDDLPHTMSAMCEVVSYHTDGSSKIYLHSMGGSGAANLLGRFCHINKGIHQAVMDIIREEEKALPDDKLYAEIVHLPESRIGNVIARPVLRQYEIPYLARSGVEKEFQLEISDLMVSVRNRKFILRSKRLNKEIIPRLTTAHNFSHSGAMPVYQFLCNLQNQHYRGEIGLFLSGLFNEFPYLPRISYKNVILSLARWHIKPNDLKPIVENRELPVAMEAIRQWKERTGLPRFVVLPDGDNELFADTESLTSLRVLYSVVKKRPQFTLREFPFDMDNALLKTQQGAFTNELLFSFYKKQHV